MAQSPNSGSNNSGSNDDIVSRYIRRVSELSQRQQQLPNPTELEALALELGLSEADLKLAQAEARACLQRARTYKRVGRWGDAIAEFEAASLVPITDPEILLDWAHAHRGQYIETRTQEHWTKAQQLARQCLTLKPDCNTAAHFLNELDAIANPNPPNTLATPEPPLPQISPKKHELTLQARWRRAQVTIVASAAIGSAAMGYLRATNQLPTPPRPVPSITTELSSPPAASPPSTTHNGQQGTITIPAQLTPGEGGPGIELETRTSGLNRYNNSTYYKGQFMVVNNTQREISKGSAQLEYLDTNGTVIHSKSVKLLDTFQPTLRPGDRHPLAIYDSNTRVPKLDQLAQIRLTPTYLESTPAAQSYPDTPTGKFVWGAPQPPGAAIQVGIRNQSTDSYGSSSSYYFKLTLEVTNTGSVNLNKLKFKVDILDSNNQSLETRPILVSYGNQPPLLRDETRLVRTTIALPRSPKKYQLTVVEVEAS